MKESLFAGTSIILIIVIFVLILALPGALTTEYTLEYWSSYLQHKPVDIGFGKCLLVGLFLSEISIPAALITWIVDSFIDNNYYIPN